MRARRPWWPRRCTGWGRGRGPRCSPEPHSPWTAAHTLLSEAGTESSRTRLKRLEWNQPAVLPVSKHISGLLLTFSLSVLTSFLSSRFFSLPGASAVGMEEWKMKSFPLHSAAWRAEEVMRLRHNLLPPAGGSDLCNEITLLQRIKFC